MAKKSMVLAMTVLLGCVGSVAFAQASAPPTRHQVRHGMKPGHHGVPSTHKHGTNSSSQD